MYITEIQIRDLVNFQGDHKVSFPATKKGFPNDLYVLVGQNNSGKSSLLQLARACTDTVHLKRYWKNINLSKKKPSTKPQSEKQLPGYQPSGEQSPEEQSSGEQSLQAQLSEAQSSRGQPSGEQQSCVQPLGNQQSGEQPPDRYGIVMCKMKDSFGKDITAAFYKTPNSGVYAWATLDKSKVLHFAFMKLTNGETLYSGETKDEGSPVSTIKIKDMIEKIEENKDWRTEKDLDSDLPWEKESKPLVIQSDSQSIKEGILDYWKKPKPDVRSKVIHFIERIGYAHYKVRTTKTGDMVLTDKNTGLDFYMNQLPDGHQYLWSMAIQMHLCCLPETNTKCLIVDEPTRCMHPSLVHHLSAEMQEYCQKHEVQFIITSHSPAVVRELGLSNVFLATRMQDGTTNIRAYINGESSDEAKQRNTVDRRMEEILFSRLVMIVKGETDRRLLSMFLSRLSRMKQVELGRILGQVPNQHHSVERLSTFRSLLRDVTVVSAGTKDASGSTLLIKPLEFFGIPYFMVVDGDFVWSREAQKKNNISSADDMQSQMHELFESCDLLRDGASLKELEALFSKGHVSGSVKGEETVSHFRKRKELHDDHNRGVCSKDCCSCKSIEGTRVETGCRSMARKRLQCVTESAFMIERTNEEPTAEELEKMKEDNRKSLVEGIFRRRRKLLQDWFRLFTWQHQEPYHLESLVKPFIKKSVKLKDSKKIDYFTEREMLILVDKMCEDQIGKELKDFLCFLESRILNYYSEHRIIRELKLRSSSIEFERKEGQPLEAKCKLLIEHDGRTLESSRAEHLKMACLPH